MSIHSSLYVTNKFALSSRNPPLLAAALRSPSAQTPLGASLLLAKTVRAGRLTLERGFCSLTLRRSNALLILGDSSMSAKNGSAISRREFAKRAAFVSAAASLSPGELLARESAAAADQPLQTPASGGPKLSPESQAEMESRLKAVFTQYGSRLNDSQKSDLRRIAAEGQAALDRLRAYPTDNGDGPALYLKPLMEREKKPAMPAVAKASSAKKS